MILISHAQKKLAAQYSFKVSTFEEILNRDITGIAIAAPATQHYLLAKRSLEANKHVFVEKPLALKISEAKLLNDLARSKAKVLMVGHLLQYHPCFLKLKQLVHSGKLGKLQYIYSNRLNLGKFRNEENILWSFAPHDISMILSLAGELPHTVLATGAAHLNPKIQDVTTTHLNFSKGLQAHIFVSWLYPFKEQKLVVVGERGMIVFDDTLDWSEKLKLYPHQVHWIKGLPEPQKAEYERIPLAHQEPLQLECQHFIESIQNNAQPRTDGAEGIRVLNVLHAAQKSLNTHNPIELEKIDANNPDTSDAYPQRILNYNTAFAQSNSIIDPDPHAQQDALTMPSRLEKATGIYTSHSMH